ncbi:hypothetical protein GCM10027590_14870 [Nocardiopsis nanhaiensis]
MPKRMDTYGYLLGLYLGDGCRVVDRIERTLPGGGERYCEYPRYHFTNASNDIIGLFTDALDRLDSSWAVHVNKRRAPPPGCPHRVHLPQGRGREDGAHRGPQVLRAQLPYSPGPSRRERWVRTHRHRPSSRT